MRCASEQRTGSMTIGLDLSTWRLAFCGAEPVRAEVLERFAEAMEIAAASPSIHLLLTDVVMPGMNGKTLAQHLVRQNPDLKVIFMSGYTGQGVGNKGNSFCNGLFLPKPFTREVLARKVRMALDSRAQAARI